MVTNDKLKENGFIAQIDAYAGSDDRYFYYYIKHLENHHLEVTPLSNMVGRNWYVHVDNCDFQTIGGCCIQTIEQFNDFMKLLEVPYELH